MDALENCVPYINNINLRDLAPRLCVLIRKGVGLPTRASTARFIYTLVQRMPNDLKEYADEIMRALMAVAFDRSPVIRKAYATAIGHICKLASPSAIEKIGKSLKTSYLEAVEEEQRMVPPIILLEISRYSPTAAGDIHHVILPLSFMGSRDPVADLSEVWKKVWEENTGGSMVGVKKWKKEIFDEIKSVLSNNPSWPLKKQAGKALSDFAKAMGEEIVAFVPESVAILNDSLSGKTWDGKSALLEALRSISCEGSSFFIDEKSHSTRKLVEDLLIRESKKNNKPYKKVAIECLGQTFYALKSSRFIEIWESLRDVVLNEEEDEELDDLIRKPLLLALQANASKAIGECFPLELELQQGEVR
jgi:proteasome component ECM29